jgi:hypothetical protein
MYPMHLLTSQIVRIVYTCSDTPLQSGHDDGTTDITQLGNTRTLRNGNSLHRRRRGRHAISRVVRLRFGRRDRGRNRDRTAHRRRRRRHEFRLRNLCCIGSQFTKVTIAISEPMPCEKRTSQTTLVPHARQSVKSRTGHTSKASCATAVIVVVAMVVAVVRALVACSSKRAATVDLLRPRAIAAVVVTKGFESTSLSEGAASVSSHDPHPGRHHRRGLKWCRRRHRAVKVLSSTPPATSKNPNLPRTGALSANLALTYRPKSPTRNFVVDTGHLANRPGRHGHRVCRTERFISPSNSALSQPAPSQKHQPLTGSTLS